MDNQEDKSSSPPVLHHTEQSEKQTITTTSQQTDHGGVDSKEKNPTTSSPPKTEAAAVESETTRAVAAADDETPAAASPPHDGNAATALVDLAETLKEESPAVVSTGKRGREESSNTGEAANKLVELRSAPLPPGPLLLSPDHQNTTNEEDSRSGDSNYSSSPVSKNTSSEQSTANDKNLIKKTKREQSPDEIEESGSGFTDRSGFSDGSG